MICAKTHTYRPSFSGPSGKLRLLLSMALSGYCLTSTAQQKDTTSVNLGEVMVRSVKMEKFTAGKKIKPVDSLTLALFRNSSLGDLLATTSSVFIKNYGPPGISTSSFRGGNASQTAILWNGLNIQNPMLGLNDLSQLPGLVFDDVTLDYGGSSALWGSGAVGGSINLSNKPLFNRGFRTSASIGLGSFGTKKLNSQVHFSNGKISSSTKVYLISSENNFTYLDTTVRIMKHANYEQKGVIQEVSIPFLKYNTITARGWYHRGFRNYTATPGTAASRASQDDENTKVMLDWTRQKGLFIPAVKLAYFRDRLDYTDSTSNTFSKSTTQTFIGEAEAFYQLNGHHKLYTGLNFTSYQANTNNYIPQKRELDKTAFMLGYSNYFFDNKFNSNINLRQEISNTFVIPVTGSMGISYRLLKAVYLKANAARVYRQPTLNDLYWPTGNPSLKAESGYTWEGGAAVKFPMGKFILETELTYFNRRIQNWINWVPGPNGTTTPKNILEVYSRGIESSSAISYFYNKLKVRLGLNTSYVLSTSVRSALANDEALNKQLIYTPRYNYGGQLSLSYQNLSLLYFHNYVGYRFSSSDNSAWLMPYQVANLKFAYLFAMPSVNLSTAFHINNLFNASYYIVALRPMPLRNYEISLTITYHKPNKTNI
ncbi:MAG: TonB-dependent receptor plug domain-containing protein [Bacteroidia bacterium]